MKKLAYILFFLFSFANVFSQMDSRDTIWFDKLWGEVAREQAQYFRVYEKVKSTYVVYDKFLNGKIQMKAEATDYMPLIQDGLTIYYDENGVVTKKAYYKNDYLSGIETIYFDGGKDSSVYEHSTGENGKKTTTVIRKCESDKIEQEKKLDGGAYTVAEEMPEFRGGMQELMKYLSEHITYPRYLNELGIGGKVFVKFIVDSSGAISNTEVIKSSGFEDLDLEAKLVVASLPNWKPGKQNGKNVPVYFNLPINFSLANPYYVLNVNNKNEDYQSVKKSMLNGDHTKVKELMEKLIKLSENDADINYCLGVALVNLKKKSKGCEYLYKAAELKHSVAEKRANDFCK